MRARIEEMRASVAARARPALAVAAARRFWIEFGTITLLAVAAAISTGQRGLARAEAIDRRTEELRAIRTGLGRWSTELQPALPAESVLWRRSEDDVRLLARGSGDALDAAHRVAQRAEEVGIGDLRIRLANPDSIPSAPAIAAAGWSIETAQSAVRIEYRGDWHSVMNLLGVLPPLVEVAELTATGEDGALRVRALLLTREVIAP